MRLVIATLAALCLSVSAFAHTAGHADLRKDKEKKANIVLEKVGDRKVQLRYLAELRWIKDERGDLQGYHYHGPGF